MSEYQLLASVNVTSSGTVINNLPTTYSHLQLFITSNVTNSGPGALAIGFCNSAGNQISYSGNNWVQWLDADGSTVRADQYTTNNDLQLGENTSGVSQFKLVNIYGWGRDNKNIQVLTTEKRSGYWNWQSNTSNATGIIIYGNMGSATIEVYGLGKI